METPATSDVQASSTRDALDEERDTYVKARRASANVAGDPRGTWGLALSGGGIRSATFCLGLIRGLAKNDVLKEFDYLSTVSGGGYVGASLGRLYGDRASATEVEDAVKSDHSMWLWWLRNNGRYLTPTGAKDLGFATASIVRGIIATHLEIGVLLLLVAGAVLLPHVLVSLNPPTPDLSAWSLKFVAPTSSIWWWLLPIPMLFFLHQAISYWYTRDQRTPVSFMVISAAAALGVFAAWQVYRLAKLAYAEGSDTPELFSASRTLWLLFLALVLTTPATAWLMTGLDWIRGTRISEVRLHRTKRLSYSLWGLALVAGLAALDSVSWSVTKWFWDARGLTQLPLGKTAVVGLVLAAARYVLPEIQKKIAVSKKPSINLEKALNILGIALAIAALVFWTTLFNIMLFPSWNWDNPPAADAPLWQIRQVVCWIVVMVLCSIYAACTCQSFELLNLASLHNFYRARIERAYVSSGNTEGPAARFPSSALASADSALTMQVAPLTEAIDGDDVALTAYAPHAHGGPIHLINCCINQSVDDRTGIYNADRKGVALTVSSMGVEVGTEFAANNQYASPPGNLSRWIAISGAAASTGMGSRTSPGFATLLFMSGIRLGYWTKALVNKRPALRSTKGWFTNAVGKYAPKPLAIIAESLARFPGQFGSIWYVSDGGHFDNTGAYPLLKRKCRLIVCADCGADPKYLFSDLESLVRKAKIDYSATIEFVDPDRVSEKVSLALRCLLGTPESVTPEADSRWLVLGRIQYDDQSEGTLVVVKPRRLDKMPFDIVAYADRNPDFPQQTTGDQFFDESQWEAYQQLGLLMGKKLGRTTLRNAMSAVDEMVNAPSSLAMVEASNTASMADPGQSRRSRVGMTVKASLGAGISLSLLVALWQGFAQYQDSRRIEDVGYVERYGDLKAKILDTKHVLNMDGLEFSAFAEESKKRGDGRFVHLRDILNDYCKTLPALGSDGIRCVELYGELSQEPRPRYDYWFVDRVTPVATPVVAYPVEGPSIVADVDGVAASAAIGGVVDAPSSIPDDRTDSVDMAAPSHPANSGQGVTGAVNASAPVPVPDASAASAGTGDADAYSGTGGVPAPVPAPAPPERPAHADVSSPVACNPSGRKRARIYIHIYDETTRPIAQSLAQEAALDLALPTPPIENVVRTAERAGKLKPYQWSSPAIVYHSGVSDGCLHAIKALMPGTNVIVKPLSTSLTSNPGMVEVWLPPDANYGARMADGG